MLIECLIKRDGPTRMNLHGFDYDFKKNGQGHYVALVNSREHREYLLSLPDFRIYDTTLETLPVVMREGEQHFEHLPRMPDPNPAGERKDGHSKRAYRRREANNPG